MPATDPPDSVHTDNRPLKFFVKMKAFGACDEENKTVYELGGIRTRLIADADAPLELVVGILSRWQEYWKYSSLEAAQTDLKRLKTWIESVEIVDGDAETNEESEP
jgi:hypothetical protein